MFNSGDKVIYIGKTPGWYKYWGKIATFKNYRGDSKKEMRIIFDFDKKDTVGITGNFKLLEKKQNHPLTKIFV